MDKALIEEITVSKLKTALLKTKRIVTDIKTGDKKPSWDGDFILYNSEKLEKRYIVGKIDVQVKGTNKTSLEKKTIRFRVDKIDLLNYQTGGGCIYFVGYVNAEQDVTLYYNLLLPYDIKKILERFDDNAQSKLLEFRALPVDDTELMINIFTLFIKERNRQISTVKASFDLQEVSVNEIHKIESFNFSLYGASGDSAIRNAFSIPVYVYANFENGGVGIPVQKINVEQMDFNDIPADVILNGEVYYNSIKIIECIDGRKIRFGTSFIMDESSYKLGFELSGNLSERIKDGHFILELLRERKSVLRIDGLLEAELNFDSSDEIIQELNTEIAFLERLKSSLDFVNCKQELMWDKMTAIDEMNIKIIVEGVAENKPIILKDFNHKIGINRLIISNLRIPVIFKQNEDGTYQFKSIFNDSIDTYFMDEENKKQTSLFLFFSKEDLLTISNLDYIKIKNSIVSKQYCYEYGIKVNYFLLDALLAYDDRQDVELIDSIISIYEWLNTQEQGEIYLLNKLQAIKRRSLFTEDEIKALLLLKVNTSEAMVRFGANVLLESFIEAKMDWCSFDEEIKAQLRRFPIYHYWKEYDD